MSKLIGYARVSTPSQDLRPQIEALKAAGCIDIFEDLAMSGVAERPVLQAALRSLNQGDTLVVVRLDRLGRSMNHLVSTVHDLAEAGVRFRSLNESIDTGSATGRLVLGIFAALAAFERDLIRERTREALATKRARGEVLGRPKALRRSQVREAKAMIEQGKGAAYVARLFAVDRSTIYRALRP